jgi:N-acetylglucosamine kinase-like BadF-type ATPase
MNNKKYVIGVDIGNTKTSYALTSADGLVIDVYKGLGANYQEIGESEMVARLQTAIKNMMQKNNIQSANLQFIYFGAAGADTPLDFKILRDQFQKVVPGTPIDFENDGWIALHSGTRGRAGMVVTMGTGNTNFAINSNGKKHRIGGLDAHLGDEIGAYALAKTALNSAVRSDDKRDHPTILSKIIPEAFGVDTTAELINLDLDKDVVKKIIQLFFQAAQKGDGLALSICWSIVKEVLKIVREFYYLLFQDEDQFTLVLEGTVFKQNYQPLTNMLELALHQRYNVNIITPDYDPVVGAVFLALKHSGISLNSETSNKIIETFKQKVAE